VTSEGVSVAPSDASPRTGSRIAPAKPALGRA
jgi:hypothetical protein